jgi:Restriction endonuclease
MTFTLNDLSDTDFENLCFDVLQSLDFVNLSWRKGTGLSSSPSDQGRDIQGQLLKKDIDGSEHYERWFVECKHWVKGVTPEKIQGALSWANAERPDVLLIVASNFFSNPTKNYLEEYKKQNKPPYRIKIWELKDLENLTAGKNELRRKYNLPSEIAFLSILNNYHIVYSMKPQLNTIEHFIELMDSLDPKMRDEAFSSAYFEIVRPRFRAPVSEEEKFSDLKIDADDYVAFRRKCLSVSSGSSPNFIHKLVSSALAWLFHMADKTALNDMQNTQRWFIECIEDDIVEEKDENHRAIRSSMLDLHQRNLTELPERLERSYGLYTYICNELVRKLLAENPSFSS